jgi:P-type Ca2+ transporter type 2C
MIPFHAKTKNQVVNLLSTDATTGLSIQEVKYRLKKHGENVITHEKKISKLKIFINQFKNPLIYILLAAILISLIIQHIVDAAVIAVIVILNSVLGYYQEYRAERALELLKKISAPNARVLRNKRVRLIAAKNVVPGDILLLEAGDKVPADARLLKTISLKTNEAILTGESTPVNKATKAITKTGTIADQNNMIFAGTIIAYGRAVAVVTATGNRTEFGRIAFSLKKVKEGKTNLQKKLEIFSKKIGTIVLGIAGLLVILGFIRNISFTESILTAMSLAVAAIPEGLPAVVTIALALGIQKMAKNKALVKKLHAVEALGAVTVICSDKTGTMTSGEMTVTQIYANNELIHITGKGYETKGLFKTISSKYDPLRLHKLMETAILCNNANLKSKSGDPTEIALLVAAKKASIETNFYRVDEVPFDSSHKYMETIDSYRNKKNLHMKGAPEVVIKKCRYVYNNGRLKIITDREREKILEMNKRMASAALRVLALAYSKDGTNKDLIFLGLMGMIDPPRKEAMEAIKLCKKAGIRVVMITGDNAITAQAVAKELNLGTRVVEGKDLDKHQNLKDLVRKIDIYARVNPEHKVAILNALQENGEIVAMTGDGINDAPALKKANVGVAMGVSGTDVSRESADIVLLDDNFNSIVKAVKHGRRIFDNIRKFVKLLLSANFGEIGLILGSLIIGLPLPLLPLQILWINLITDSFPAIALGLDPAEKNVMNRKPRDPKEQILNGNMAFLILTGLILTVLGLVLFSMETATNGMERARTMVLLFVVLFELLLVFVCRSETKNAFQVGLFSNKMLIYSVLLALAIQVLVLYTPLADLFKLHPLNLMEWGKVLLFALGGITILEVRKLFLKK